MVVTCEPRAAVVTVPAAQVPTRADEPAVTDRTVAVVASLLVTLMVTGVDAPGVSAVPELSAATTGTGADAAPLALAVPSPEDSHPAAANEIPTPTTVMAVIELIRVRYRRDLVKRFIKMFPLVAVRL
jgi:hypothetical protein